MNIFKRIFKGLLEFNASEVINPKEVIKHFLGEELNDLNKEILQTQEYLRKLESKRERVEIMVFGT